MDPMQVDSSGEVVTPLDFPLGDNSELLKVATGDSVLRLLCGRQNEDVRPFRRGELTVIALRNPEMETMGMVLCFVGRLYWPLGKDSIVLRLGPRRFCFSLPGLLYGVTLPDRCTEDELRGLQQILRTFCVYQDRAGEEDSEYCTLNPEGDFWASAYPNIMQIIYPGTSSVDDDASASDEEVESAPPRWAAPIFGEGPQHPNALKVHRAMEFSTVTKLVARALVGGLINESLVNIIGAPAASRPALASIRVVSDVVDVANMAAHTGVGSPLPDSFGRFRAKMERPFWMFEEAGLLFILEVVTVMGMLAAASSAAARGGSVLVKVDIGIPPTSRTRRRRRSA